MPDTINWLEIDTVLLDMDGTLLDLHFDNRLWNVELPKRYAANNNLEHDEAEKALYGHMREIYGTLDFYCLDYWARHTGMDIIALHEELTHLVSYRDGAQAFLGHLKTAGIQRTLITNAHRGAFGVKDAIAGLSNQLDVVVSSHDYNSPKEDQLFWQSLMREQPFNPERCVFVDDNEAVLDAAAEFGIRHLIAVHQPDSQKPRRDALRYSAIDHFDELSERLATVRPYVPS
ncbi:MAG: GMP/IMP nucleotidase [Pseudomonadaceae bacterium]|nr:GMP/IMP nucleotidase [Pseudomonadaceae bacterium]